MEELVLASAYLPGDLGEAPKVEVSKNIDYCISRGIAFLISCETNAHHIVWRSGNTNKRVELLYEYLVSNNIIMVINEGCEPTFCNLIHEEILDLTLTKPSAYPKIHSWRVSQEASLSHHMHLTFKIEALRPVAAATRFPKLTN